MKKLLFICLTFTLSYLDASQQNQDSIQTQIGALQLKNNKLQDEIDKLNVQKANAVLNVTKINNRKKMIKKRRDEIKNNNIQISKLKTQLAALPSNNSNNQFNWSRGKGPGGMMPIQGGGTMITDPATGKTSSLGCQNGVCPQAVFGPGGVRKISQPDSSTSDDETTMNNLSNNQGGGTMITDSNGNTTSLGCKNGICPLVAMRPVN